jgi:hypothetical protein
MVSTDLGNIESSSIIIIPNREGKTSFSRKECSNAPRLDVFNMEAQ